MREIKEYHPKILILLAGLPASGKSTLSQKLSSCLLIDPYFRSIFGEKPFSSIVDTDIIRETIFGFQFDPLNEQLVIQKKYTSVINELKNNSIIIIDDLHYYASMRHQYYELANFKGVFYFSIYLSTPLDQALEWNEKRGFKIPNRLIIEIDQKFDPLGQKYKWDLPNYELNPTGGVNDEMIRDCLSIIKAQYKSYLSLKSVNSSKNSHTHSEFETFEVQIRKLFHFIISSYSEEIITPEINRILSLLGLKINDQNLRKSQTLGSILSKLKPSFKLFIISSNSDCSLNAFIEFLSSITH